MAKKFLMTFIWRISQTGPFLSLFFWSAALAGIFWPIFGDRPDGLKGPLWVFITDSLRVSPERAALVGLTLLFLTFAAFIVFIGFLYDRVLKLWVEQTIVAMEKNPYAEDLLFLKERLQWDQFYLPLARAVYRVSPDPELKEAIARVETWVAAGRIEATGKFPKVP